MKKISYIILLIILPVVAFSQFRPYGSASKKVKKSKIKKSHFDVGVFTGTIFALTDIGGTGDKRRPSIMDVQIKETQLTYGVFGRYKFLPANMALYGGLQYGKLSGDDKLSINTSRYLRNKSFTNNIIDFTIRYEYYLPLVKFFYVPLDVYASTGLNLFYHKPILKENFTDDYIASNVVQPFKNFQVGTPFSFGATYTFPANIKSGLDVCWKKTYTDYLDGFTRPASKGMDGYFTITASASYIITNVNSGRMYSYKKPSYYKKSKFSKRKMTRKRFKSRSKF